MPNSKYGYIHRYLGLELQYFWRDTIKPITHRHHLEQTTILNCLECCYSLSGHPTSTTVSTSRIFPAHKGSFSNCESDRITLLFETSIASHLSSSKAKALWEPMKSCATDLPPLWSHLLFFLLQPGLATTASLLFLEHTRHASSLGHLCLLFSLLRSLFPRYPYGYPFT